MEKKRRSYRFRFTLATRLMMYFVIFGIAIGYLTFFFTSLVNPLIMVRRVSSHLVERMETSSGRSFGELIEHLIENEASRKDLEEQLSPLLTGQELLRNLNLYTYDPDQESWTGTILTGESVFSRYTPDNRLSKILDSVTSNEKTHESKPLLRQPDEMTFIFDITEDTDVKRYALGLTFQRAVLAAFIRENRTEFVIFDIFVGIFSIILAKMFSKRISKPISRLTRKASRIAEGDLTQRFRIRRRDEIGSLAHSLNTMADEIERRLNETEKQLTTMKTMNKIDKAVLSSTSRSDLLERVMGFVSGQFDESRTLLVLKNDKKNGFEITSFTPGMKSGMMKDIPLISNSLISTELQDRISRTFQTSEPRDEIISIYKDTTGHFNSVKTLLNVPIVQGGIQAGSIIMTKPGRVPYGKDEVSFIQMLSDQVGVALQSVREVENREALNLGILRALTKAIDAKSPWTAGHSERVAKHSETIGNAMNMNEEDLRELTISALLHDIGKIGVAESILNKPDTLTDDEFAAIKEHPGRGADILADIPEYANVLNGVEFHHERWDSSGYPEGRGREDIPFFARIIAVADVYDAVTYDRPYRTGMSPEEAVEFMLRGKGTMFDPDLTDLFLSTLEKI